MDETISLLNSRLEGTKAPFEHAETLLPDNAAPDEEDSPKAADEGNGKHIDDTPCVPGLNT